MKPFASLFFLLASISLVCAQNQYFVPFNTDRSHLFQHLQRYGGLEVLESEDSLQVHVQHLGSKIRYHFHQDSIYQISIQNQYKKRKYARQAHTTCLDFLRRIKASEVSFFIRGLSQHLVYVREGISYELIYTEHGKRDIAVALKAKCVKFTPEDRLEPFDYLTDF